MERDAGGGGGGILGELERRAGTKRRPTIIFKHRLSPTVKFQGSGGPNSAPMIFSADGKEERIERKVGREEDRRPDR